eukprot:1161003-Pelagomonas_calceolata.AAC.2
MCREGILPPLVKEREVYWLKRAGSLLHHKGVKYSENTRPRNQLEKPSNSSTVTSVITLKGLQQQHPDMLTTMPPIPMYHQYLRQDRMLLLLSTSTSHSP